MSHLVQSVVVHHTNLDVDQTASRAPRSGLHARLLTIPRGLAVVARSGGQKRKRGLIESELHDGTYTHTDAPGKRARPFLGCTMSPLMQYKSDQALTIAGVAEVCFGDYNETESDGMAPLNTKTLGTPVYMSTHPTTSKDRGKFSFTANGESVGFFIQPTSMKTGTIMVQPAPSLRGLRAREASAERRKVYDGIQGRVATPGIDLHEWGCLRAEEQVERVKGRAEKVFNEFSLSKSSHYDAAFKAGFVTASLNTAFLDNFETNTRAARGASTAPAASTAAEDRVKAVKRDIAAIVADMNGRFDTTSVRLTKKNGTKATAIRFLLEKRENEECETVRKSASAKFGDAAFATWLETLLMSRIFMHEVLTGKAGDVKAAKAERDVGGAKNLYEEMWRDGGYDTLTRNKFTPLDVIVDVGGYDGTPVDEVFDRDSALAYMMSANTFGNERQGDTFSRLTVADAAVHGITQDQLKEFEAVVLKPATRTGVQISKPIKAYLNAAERAVAVVFGRDLMDAMAVEDPSHCRLVAWDYVKTVAGKNIRALIERAILDNAKGHCSPLLDDENRALPTLAARVAADNQLIETGNQMKLSMTRLFDAKDPLLSEATNDLNARANTGAMAEVFHFFETLAANPALYEDEVGAILINEASLCKCLTACKDVNGHVPSAIIEWCIATMAKTPSEYPSLFRETPSDGGDLAEELYRRCTVLKFCIDAKDKLCGGPDSLDFLPKTCMVETPESRLVCQDD